MWWLFSTKILHFVIESRNIADAAYLAGGKEFDVAPTAVIVVTEGDAVVELQD